MHYKKHLLGFFIYLGTAIGLGVFALPYAFSQSGYISFFYFLFLLPVVFLTTMAFSKILTSQKDIHTVAGSAGFFLGNKFKHLALGIVFLEMGGALLAYFGAGGIFLNILLPIFSSYQWGIVFALITFTLIFFDIKSIGKSELFLTLALLILFIFFTLTGFYNFKSYNLTSNLNFDGDKFLAYGVILFSLAGWSAIPALRELFGREEKWFFKTVGAGTLIIAFIYLLFTTATLGAFLNPSPEALGSYSQLGITFRLSGALLGLINVFTSAIVIGLYLKNVFRRDYNLPSTRSFFLMAIPTFILYLYLLKVAGFIKIISFIGGAAVAADATLIWIIYQKLTKPTFLKKLAIFLLISIFLLGAAYETYFTFFKN